jgi:hypothetical protein
MWNSSSNTTVEGNTFIDCQREISLGLIDQSGRTDHSGGVARNNFIYRSSGVGGDAAILVADSPDTQVLHNTIFINRGYASPIEYRFSQTTGTVIANNLLDGVIQVRDGARGTVSSNYTSATAAMFVNPSAADLHLAASASAAIDKATAASGVTQDYDGQARPYGASADLGADEYRPASAPTPPAPGAPGNVRVIR